MLVGSVTWSSVQCTRIELIVTGSLSHNRM